MLTLYVYLLADDINRNYDDDDDDGDDDGDDDDDDCTEGVM